MRKFFSILTVLIILLAGGFITLEHYSATIIANLISETTHTTVSLDRVHFHKDGFTLKNLTINSPPGYSLKRALKVEKIKITTPYVNYLKKPIVIKDIQLQRIYLGIQFKDKARTEGNWLTLLKDSHNDSSSISGRSNSARIGSLLLKDIYVEIALAGESPRSVQIPYLAFENITTDDGKVVEELTQVIMHQLMKELFLQKSIRAVFDLPGNVFKSIFPF